MGQDQLRIFRRQSRVSVLGPGLRAVIWVQGCSFHCPGCIVPESWDHGGGESIAVTELANWVLMQRDIEGITLSGGEPFEQAGGLTMLVRSIRARRDLSLMCYSGYRLEELQHYGSEAQRELLSLVDLLIDGPYIRAKHADLLWRGSSNQRLIALSDRYKDLVDAIEPQLDRSAGMTFEIDASGFSFTGVPAQPDFMQQFEDGLADFGIVLGRGEAKS